MHFVCKHNMVHKVYIKKEKACYQFSNINKDRIYTPIYKKTQMTVLHWQPVMKNCVGFLEYKRAHSCSSMSRHYFTSSPHMNTLHTNSFLTSMILNNYLNKIEKKSKFLFYNVQVITVQWNSIFSQPNLFWKLGSVTVGHLLPKALLKLFCSRPGIWSRNLKFISQRSNHQVM